MKRTVLLLLISVQAVYTWATAPTVYNFANITTDMIITSDGVIGEKIYTIEDTCPAVSKPEEVSAIHVQVNGMDNLEIIYTASAAKENVIIFRDEYMQFDGKYGSLKFSDLHYGDTIRMLVASKGNNDPTFTALSGARGTDQVVESTKETLSYNEYKTVEFYATESIAEIKEITAGFQIKTATIAPFVCQAPETVRDTLYVCQYDTAWIQVKGSLEPFIVTGDFVVRDTLVTLAGCDSLREAFVHMLPSYLMVYYVPIPIGDTSVYYNGLTLPLGITVLPYSSIDGCDSIYQYRVEEDSTMTKGISEVVDITPNSALIKWSPDTLGVVTRYDIDIYADNTLFAHYEVDSEGEIISSQRYAPSVYRLPTDTTTTSTDYFTISVDDLDPGTDYYYTITGSDNASAPVYLEQGTFTTSEPEGLMEALPTEQPSTRKMIRHGQVFILRGDDVYTITGQKTYSD